MHSFRETLHMVGTTHSDLIVCSGYRELGLTDHQLIVGMLSKANVKQKQCIGCFRSCDHDYCWRISLQLLGR